ncbi:MAG: type IV toxin-antitoxin system AbiEi family antitoxin domain-containing protein [Solirubrobacterales bacterium]
MGAIPPYGPYGANGRDCRSGAARIASRTHGVVTRLELLAAGISAKQIRVRLEPGTLIRVHRAVYPVRQPPGHPDPRC